MKPTSRQNSIEKNKNTYSDYIYKPLATTKGSIRLLKLHASPDSSWPLRCSLFHTSFSSAPPYIALSYVWGESPGSTSIHVDSDHVSITPNLKHALQRLRPTPGEEDLVMWVDAICINQKDIPERNSQTANMRAIYQHAKSVAVFLGLESNRSAGAMQFARDLNSCSSREEVRRLIRDPMKKVSIEGLVTLFRRQYWWRIWVIQEVSSAREATVYCGDDEISWTDFDRVCDKLKDANGELQSLFYKSPSFVRTLTTGGPRGLQLSRFSPTKTAPPLLELLLSHKSKKSTDPKDKVYALIGVSESVNTFGTIDYSQSMREVYTHTAQHIITTSRKLDVICVKQHDKNQYDLPSWVPDWTRPPSKSGATVVGLHHHQPPFEASGDTLGNFQFLPNGVLKVTGVIIDTISTTGIAFKQSPRHAPSEVMPVLQVFNDWWNIFVSTHSNTLTSQAIFGRTISGGNWEHEDVQIYANKLEAIFALSDGLLSESDMLRLDPPSRSSTGTLLASSTTPSMAEEEEDLKENGDEEEKLQLSAILSAALTMNRRRLFVLRDGSMGLGPAGAEVGDVVCMLLGCRYPVVLRREGEYCVLIGEAYVDGFMYGEGMARLDEGADGLKSFTIH